MRMEEKTIYYISEAAKKVQVESHVLRYWEDELKLPIKRNEMGHRYYTEQDIKQLQEIKHLKEQGLQLKAIRTVLFKAPALSAGTDQAQALREVCAGTAAQAAEEKSADRDRNNIETRRDKLMDMVKERAEEKAGEDSDAIVVNKPHRYMVALSGDESRPAETKEQYDDTDKSRKAARLQYLLQHMITEAVKSANKELCCDVKESILKELDYQFRMQEERETERWKKEEEHYRKIDEMIRERHKPRERLGKGRKKG